VRFGSPYAFQQDMMLHRTDHPHPGRALNCTIEEARQLLADIRAGYRSLSSNERALIKHTISAVAREQSVTTTQDEGKQCYGSAL
jgi:hypothetical protein